MLSKNKKLEEEVLGFSKIQKNNLKDDLKKNMWDLIPRNIWTSKNKIIKTIGIRGPQIINQLVEKGYLSTRFELVPRPLKPSFQELKIESE